MLVTDKRTICRRPGIGKMLVLLLLALIINVLFLAVTIGLPLGYLYLFSVKSISLSGYVVRQFLLFFALLIIAGPMILSGRLRKSEEELGELVTEKEQPILFGLSTDAARAMGLFPIRNVRLRPDSIMAISVHPRIFLFRREQTTLICGLSSFIGMNIHELKAVLAHEHAHIFHCRRPEERFIRNAMAMLSSSLHIWTHNPAARFTRFINPFYWLVWFLILTMGPWGEELMRSQEYRADSAAGEVYGSRAVTESEKKGLINGHSFDLAVGKLVRWLECKKLIVDDVLRYTERICSAMDETDVRQILARQEVMIGRFHGTHPTPAARAEAVEEFENTIEEDAAPAFDAITGLEGLRKRLTDIFYKELEKDDEKYSLKDVETVKADDMPLSYTECELESILEKFVSEAGDKGLELHYDKESLEKADRYFAAHPEFFKGPPERDIIQDVILYFGETIRKLHGGEWVFPIVSPPRLSGVGPHSITLEVYELFLTELAAANYPSVMPAYIRSLARLGISDETDASPPMGTVP